MVGGRALRGLIVVVVVAALAAFAVVSARRLGPQRPPTGALADHLADRVTALMENDFRAVTAGDDEPVRCAARPFGVRPEGLTRAAQATTVYAWVYCRTLRGPDRAERTLLDPVAVRFDRPPSVRVPERGADRERSILRIFPADVRPALRRVDPRTLRPAVDGTADRPD
jgi:hypothetical protein